MLDRLVSALPAKLQDKAKGLAVALGAVVGILTVVLPDMPQWLTVAVWVTTALGVYWTPNRTPLKPVTLTSEKGPEIPITLKADGEAIYKSLIALKRQNEGPDATPPAPPAGE